MKNIEKERSCPVKPVGSVTLLKQEKGDRKHNLPTMKLNLCPINTLNTDTPNLQA